MPVEPAEKRAIAFFDGQNLYHAARQAFGYPYPNYDPVALAASIAAAQGWKLAQVRFYTGVPALEDNAFWHQFWTNKLIGLGRRNVTVYTRQLVYRNQVIRLGSGATHRYRAGEEKGIDVRIAIDIVSMAWEGTFDVALLFSQDQDLSEVAREIRAIARRQDRWIKIASAFPYSAAVRKARGVNWTDWIRIGRATYDSCLDPRDYRSNPAAAAAEP